MKMKRPIMLLITLTVFTALPLVAGCASAAALESSQWTLLSYGPAGDLQSPLPGTEVTIDFDGDNGEVSGSAGCNHYSGGYTLDGDKLTIAGPFAVTEMWCGDEKDAQEKAYLAVLLTAETWEVDGDNLTITGADGVLNFTKK